MIYSQIYFNVSLEYEKTRDVIMFLKTAWAQDLMMDSPNTVELL